MVTKKDNLVLRLDNIKKINTQRSINKFIKIAKETDKSTFKPLTLKSTQYVSSRCLAYK